MPSQYGKFEDSEPVTFNPEKTTLKMACCDCGVVHFIGISVQNKKSVTIGFMRDNRATGQLRRHNYGNLYKEKVSK